MRRTNVLGRVLLACLVVSLVASQAGVVSAGVNVWTSRGPEGGSVPALAIDPATPTTLYAGTDGRGVFKSTNGAASWSVANAGLSNMYVHVLAIDPLWPTTLYAGTSGGVFKSADGGGSWRAINSGLTQTVVWTLAIDPGSPTTLYAGTEFGGVFKSTNGGSSWSAVNTGLTATFVRVLAIDPVTPTTLYAGTFPGGVFKSTNGGADWSAVNTGLASDYVEALAIDPAWPATLYAGTRAGVFKSTSGGADWSEASSGLPGARVVTALAVDPTTPSILYAGIHGGGVFRSTNGGRNWSDANTGLGVGYVGTLLLDPATPTTIYAATDCGVFKSTNSGGNWSTVNSGLTVRHISSVAIDPSKPTTLYLTTGGGVFKSTNAGGDWKKANTGLPGAQDCTALVINPATPATLYLGIHGGGVFKSTNGAETWSEANTGLPSSRGIPVLAIDPVTPTTVYVGTCEGNVFKSTNGAANWSAANTGLTNACVHALAIDPATPTTLYAGTDAGVFKSTNGGASWNAMNTGLPNTYVHALAIDPATPTTLYVGLCGGGVSKSIDGGAGWSPANSGAADACVRALATDPLTPTTLYAGTELGGVFKSTNGGGSWNALNTGLTHTDVHAVAIDPATPTTLYAGTWGAGVFDLQQMQQTRAIYLPLMQREAEPIQSTRYETLYFNGLQWNAVVGWNPYSSSMNNAMAIVQWDNARVIMFETPYLYNMLDGKTYPLLADGPYTWNAAHTEITFRLKAAAHWSDGTPVTAADVAYTWATHIRYSTNAGNSFQDYIASITAVDARTVLVKAKLDAYGKAVNPLQLPAYLCGNYVIQKAWTQKLEARTGGNTAKFVADTAEDVVYSGPYHKFSADETKVVLVRDDNYWGKDASMWGKLPAPKYLAHVLFKDNDAGSAALARGEVDVSSQFNANVQVLWLNYGLPISTYLPYAPYGIGASLPSAFYNLKAYGLDNVVIRKAIAIAVDYPTLIANAVTNQSATFDQVPRSLMNVTPGEQALFDHAAVAPLQWAGNDIEGAKRLLDDAGIKDTNGDGWREYNGRTLHYVATCPNGWSDWQAAIEVVAASGKKIGIDIVTNYPEWGVYQTVVTKSDTPLPAGYEIFMMWSEGAGPTQPWSRIRHLLSSEYIGTANNWHGNWGQYSNPRVDQLINEIPTLTDAVQLKADYTELVQIYLTDVPSFTLMYRPQLFHTVNESVWTGFPHQGDGSNPPVPPMVCTDGWGVACLYNLRLVQ